MVASFRGDRWFSCSAFVALVTFVTALGCLALSACGGDDEKTLPSIETLFPKDNEVAGWVEDRTLSGMSGAPGVQTATSAEGAEALIDGDAELFRQWSPAAFGWENYTDGTNGLDLRIWQFADTTTAEAAYTGVLADARYGGTVWQTASLGNQGRVGDTGASWWFNVHKGLYLVESKLVGSNAAQLLEPTRAFTAAVVAKLP